jgi:hypothetical protein
MKPFDGARRVLSCVALVCASCSHQPSAVEGQPQSSVVLAAGAPQLTSASEPPFEELTEPYPAGRWRLAPPESLDHVVLWFSHILIRHRDVPPKLVSLNLPHWLGAPQAPDRSRAEAFELARRVAEEAQLRPDQFARLAEVYSEDVATERLGGAVGGLRASAIRLPVVLDVMASLRPGEVSRVVETGYGFHVFMRRSPPEERTVSGAHIVIAHHDAPWLAHFLARRPPPQRSKAEARELADRVYAELQRDPLRFESLVEEYSDHRDAVRGGDLGTWSSREPTPFPREVETLLHLEVGQVAPPMDSLFGIQIIMRAPARQRVQYASSSIELDFDPAAPDGSATSEARVRERMQRIGDDVRAHPDAFDRYQRELCCTRTAEWIGGRGDPLLELALERLEPGQVAASAIRGRQQYRLPKRLRSGGRAVEPVAFELPAPDHAELEAVVASRGFGIVNAALPVLEELPVNAATRARLRALHEARAASKEGSSFERFAALQTDLRSLLGENYSAYRTRLRDSIEPSLLTTSPRFRLAVPSAPEGFLVSAGDR